MSATISDDGLYRYTLERRWGAHGGREVLWVMLNPSTADAENDDPTITRCVGYSKAWGFSGIMVGNLYAYRATKPADLWDAMENIDIARHENDQHLRRMAACATLIMCAWGGWADDKRASHVISMLSEIGTLYCLGVTKQGHPLHPLYKSKELRPVLLMPFSPQTEGK